MRPATSSPTATRERLLRAGLAIARRSGLRAVTVRGVAARAGANLGSFVHHFGTREAFVAELLERWYAPLLGRLDGAVHADGSPLRQLQALVMQLASWAVANAAFIAHLVQDAAHGERAARRFLRDMPARHPARVLAAIQKAQAAGEMRRETPTHVLLFILGSLALPALLFSGLDLHRILPRAFSERLRHSAVDLAQIERRLEWVLRGLAP
jgi:AcrR family transcriptional regulator